MINDASGNLTFDFADRTSIVGKNLTATTISAGTPIVVSSFVGTDVYGIQTQRNDIEARSPE